MHTAVEVAFLAPSCVLSSLLLLLQARKCRTTPHNAAYEHKFRALKYGRTLTYAVGLAATQAALLLGHVTQHWPDRTWDVALNGAVLAVYAMTAAVLALCWANQLAMQLGGMLVLALVQPAVLFLQDITAVRPDGTFDAEHVARVILHCLQFVLLLALLVSEVIIQQHQLLQKGSSAGDVLPTTAANGAARYHQLPGSAAEADGCQRSGGSGSSSGRAGKQEQQQEQQQQRYQPWQPGDSRWQMTASAFYYVWPTSGSLKLRLLACLLLVLLERVINLAAPIAFKHMVEVLSAITTNGSSSGSDAPASAAAAAAAAAAAVGGLRQLLAAVAGGAGQQQHHIAAVHSLGASSNATASHIASFTATAAAAHIATPSLTHAPDFFSTAAAGAAAAPNSSRLAAAAVAAGSSGSSLVAVLAPFWVLFYPWVFVYLAAFFLRGGSGSEGLLANLRDILYIPITQAAFRRISNDVFGHLLELDLSFHLHRKTGLIMRILDRGTSSIQDTVSIVLFNVLPQLIDILVACTYLASALRGPWVALIVLATVGSYVPLTLVITEQRGKVRKVMNALDNEREGRATDMLLNYETIKYFCAEGRELAGYDAATRSYQAAEYWQMAFLSLLSLVQSLIVWCGLAAGLVACVWGASRGRVSVGDTVLFISMMQQLYVPLTFFGSYYRQVTKALVDMENMFELLATQPRVRDAARAAALRVTHGAVEFREVVFSYSPATSPPVLRGLSFQAPGGRSLAVVGSTGSGKSTLLRLLLRFYDPQSGCVTIDGQDIRHCTQGSVRGAIGVVPQDCVLFNDTVMYNIRYARPGAPDSQVYEAAQVSHIHDHLSRFPQGYNTRVGERGLRLSGGEKQRVAFARAVLKAPAIMVLDEATSSLDSLTERLIQDSLAAIRGKCTQVIVAHRLSTIMDADTILVLAKGQVAESGSHAELVAAGGLYAAMWARQQDSSSATAAVVADEESDGGQLPAAAAVVAEEQQQQRVCEVSVADDGAEQQQQQQPRGRAGGGAGLPPRQAHQQHAATSSRGGGALAAAPPPAAAAAASGSSSSTPARAGGDAADAFDDDEELEQQRPRHPGASSRSKLRCNSSCGHGRHTTFWSREQVEDQEDEELDEGDTAEQAQQQPDEGGPDDDAAA